LFKFPTTLHTNTTRRCNFGTK